jgi:hypothetical protein
VKSKKTTAADIGEAARDDAEESAPEVPSTAPAGPRKSTVAKVSHTLSIALAERLEEFAFFQRVSESAVIEFALNSFFAQKGDDAELGDILRRDGAGRRRKS